MTTPSMLDPAKLPLDVFDLTSTGLEVESLVAGHGKPEAGGKHCYQCMLCSCGNTCCGGCSGHPIPN